MIITDQDPRLLEWIGQKLNTTFDQRTCRTVAHVTATSMCVVVYSRFSQYGCEITVYSDSPKLATREFLKAIYSYPFIQLGLRRVTFVTRASNTRAIRLALYVGAKQEGRIREAFGDEDGILLGLLAGDCWLLDDRRAGSA